MCKYYAQRSYYLSAPAVALVSFRTGAGSKAVALQLLAHRSPRAGAEPDVAVAIATAVVQIQSTKAGIAGIVAITAAPREPLNTNAFRQSSLPGRLFAGRVLFHPLHPLAEISAHRIRVAGPDLVLLKREKTQLHAQPHQ